MEEVTTLHFITVFSIWSFKLATLIIGYLITRMGYNLLTKGVTGGFKFSGNFSGFRADLVSASPGLLFLLLGICLMVTSILKESKFSTQAQNIKPNSAQIQNPVEQGKPELAINRG